MDDTKFSICLLSLTLQCLKSRIVMCGLNSWCSAREMNRKNVKQRRGVWKSNPTRNGKRMKKRKVACYLALFALALSAQMTKAETIHCGLKTITVQNGKITHLRHEDGTVHSGSAVADNWSYNGKSIKNRYDDKPIQCGTKPKSRDEIISELSSRFVANPKLYGMDKQEAKWMMSYTSNLMITDKNCHLLVDAAKSSQRKDTFYIDCNNQSGQSRRYWVSRNDLKEGSVKPPATPISTTAAVELCNAELRSKTAHPATYNPSLLTGTTSRVVEANGRNVVSIDFSAKNAFGVEGKFQGKCILEAGRLIEATIADR